MAVNIRDTKHFKKGEKLPDGTTAKRGVVWNTKTNKRVTGKVVMSASGQGGMGATKSYKAGRSVSSMKRAAAKKNAAASRPRTKTGSGSSPSSGSPTPTPKPKREMSAAAKRAKQTRTGRRVADTAGRAGMTMAREKRGLTSTPTQRFSSSAANNMTYNQKKKYGTAKPSAGSSKDYWGKTPWGMAANAVNNLLSNNSAKPAPAKNYKETRVITRGGGPGSGYARKVKQGKDPKTGKWVDIGVVK